MLRKYQPCLPTRGTKVPTGPDWIHEIKYDGYRMIVTARGQARPPAYPQWPRLDRSLSVDHRGGAQEPANLIRHRWRGSAARGRWRFRFQRAALPAFEEEVQLYAFDILALDGDDLRKLPLSVRKTKLARLLARRPEGIFVAPFEAGEIGPDLFRKACEFGLEGLVSKRRDRPYRSGRSPDWVKMKNRKHPATTRGEDFRW